MLIWQRPERYVKQMYGTLIIADMLAFGSVRHQGQSQNQRFWWLVILPLAWNLRTDRSFALLFQDFLLAKVDEKLPLASHVSGTFQ